MRYSAASAGHSERVRWQLFAGLYLVQRKFGRSINRVCVLGGGFGSNNLVRGRYLDARYPRGPKLEPVITCAESVRSIPLRATVDPPKSVWLVP